MRAQLLNFFLYNPTLVSAAQNILFSLTGAGGDLAPVRTTASAQPVPVKASSPDTPPPPKWESLFESAS